MRLRTRHLAAAAGGALLLHAAGAAVVALTNRAPQMPSPGGGGGGATISVGSGPASTSAAPAADAAVSGPLYIGAVRTLPHATLSRELRAELEASLLGEQTPAHIRKTIYGVYDRGEYARAWYQLRPAAREGRRARSARVGEEDDTSYTLWFDGRERYLPRSLFSVGFSLGAEALGLITFGWLQEPVIPALAVSLVFFLAGSYLIPGGDEPTMADLEQV